MFTIRTAIFGIDRSMELRLLQNGSFVFLKRPLRFYNSSRVEEGEQNLTLPVQSFIVKGNFHRVFFFFAIIHFFGYVL